MKTMLRLSFCLLFACIFFSLQAAPPANDNCANAVAITIPSSGYAFGTFSSANYDLTQATVQAGETFYSTILSAGQNKKSVWFKFTLPTARKCTLFVKQPTPIIPGNEVGFTIYKASNCFPNAAQADSALLAAQTVFGYSTNPCMKPGDYYVQVSSTNNANGNIFIELQLDSPNPAPYDLAAQAYDFGVLGACQNFVDHEVGCQTITGISEICPTLGAAWSQSTWYTFTTPAYVDLISVLVSPPNGYSFASGATPIIGYNLYQGNARVVPIGSLSLIDGCVRDTIEGSYTSNLQRNYKCTLLPNTTYSVQVFFPANFEETVQVQVYDIGVQAGQGPRPTTAGITGTNNAGILPSGYTTLYDYFGCNTRLSTNACGTENLAAGITFSGTTYELADWFRFELSQSANVTFYNYASGGTLHARLYRKDVNASCANITAADKYSEWDGSNTLTCLPPGKYSLQILGNDDPQNPWNYSCQLASNLGQQITMQYDVNYVNPDNNYSLNVAGAFDTINRIGVTMSQLKQDTVYDSRIDTFGCNNTVLPIDSDKCNAGGSNYSTNTKAIYREFTIGDANANGTVDSGVVFMQFSTSWNYWHGENKLYRGNANALTIAQNKHFYPDTFSGLTPSSLCMGNQYCIQPHACVVPGTYTLVTYGDSTMVGGNVSNTLQLQLQPRKHYSAATAQNMGHIFDTLNVIGGSTVNSNVTYFNCYDNPATIGGQAPCQGYAGQPMNKLIYRQFYLSQTSLVTIGNASQNSCSFAGLISLFRGQATAGIGGLTPYSAASSCVGSFTTNPCEPLPAGWYTIVSYADGPTYANPTNSYNGYFGGNGGAAGMPNQVSVSVTPAPQGPMYNRPYKAAVDSITHQPFDLKFGNRGTAAYPVTDTTYQLYTENYNCLTDTPFLKHPVDVCGSYYSGSYAQDRVTYWVFKITQESYVRISGLGGPYTGAKIYAFDVRVDSAKMVINNPIQPCIQNADYIALCRLQPGTYTLVVFPGNNYQGSALAPSIYIDKPGYSRFDHANGAYDFAAIPTDSVWRSGKVGDVNPLNASRAASNDFFYCTTGAQPTDPDPQGCYLFYDSLIYRNAINNPQYNNNSGYSLPYSPIRNLWYTFVLNYGGTCRVRVNNKTPNKATQYPFAVYSSNVNGSTPFATVKSTGQVDSTIQQGLQLIKSNSIYSCYNINEVSFFQNPCIGIPTRYYIKVDNSYDLEPNSQCEVEILYDTVITPPVKFDHYSQANTINVTGAGQFCGVKDNFTCATRDTFDPSPSACSPRNLWYKVVVNSSGYLRMNYKINNAWNGYDGELTFFRQTVAGDSTNLGLQNLNLNYYYDNVTATSWGQTCVYPGTYYVIMTGCNFLNEDVQPCVWFDEQTGDYCGNAISTTISSPSVVNLNGVIDCHTIGTDFGEDGSNMGCLIPNGSQVAQYKSSWFRVNITANDTFDLTPVITENTNVLPNAIRYRLMIGDCNAMNTGSCFVSSLTVNTFNCLTKGTYFIQVVTPISADIYGTPTTGDISVQFTAVKSPPGCNPVQTCFVVAGFTTSSPCNTDSVRFVNTSTSGDSIRYHWTFGYNNDTANTRNPSYLYPTTLDSQTYSVLLKVTNTKCNKVDSVRQTITVKKKPHVQLKNDTTLCFDIYTYYYDTIQAKGRPSGTTYLWDNNSTDSIFYLQDYCFTYQQTFEHWVQASYNGCEVTDTFKLTLKPKPVVDLGVDVVLCAGQDFTGNIYNGIAGETYLWSNGAAIYNPTTNVTGDLWAQVSAAGCIARDTINISNTATAQPLGRDTFICTGASLTLDATTAGATIYTWDDGSTNATRTVIDSGTYTVDITIGLCQVSDTVHVSRASATKPFITGDSLLCPSGDSAIIFVAGSFSSYLWNNNTTNDSLKVFAAGSYRITVTNAQGCASADTLVVTASPNMTLTTVDTMVKCFGQTNGSIKLTVTGGTPSYGYVWENSSTLQNRTALGIGIYRVTVTDGAGCKRSKSDTITQPNLLTTTAIAIDDSCFGANKGRITATPVGGTLPYLYAWSGGGSNAIKSNIGAGIYTITVTDKNNCTATAFDTVYQPSLMVVTKIDSAVKCYGTATGKIDLSVSGGTAGYTYVWNNAATSQDLINIQAGNYAVTVRDANLCSVVMRDTLLNPDSLQLSFTITNVACGGGNNGAINLSVLGGTLPHSYLWENASTNEDRTGLSAGGYQVTVTDKNNCSTTKAATVIAAGSLTLISNDTAAKCFGTNTGRGYLIPVGGTAPFHFSWSDGDTNKIRTNLSAGIFVATVTDANLCTAIDTVFISQPTLLNILHADTNPRCFGSSEGKVAVTLTGGSPAYTYNWGGGITTKDRLGVAAGSYCVTVTDANSCSATNCFTLTNPPALSYNRFDTTTSCFGGNDGRVFVNGSGGTGVITYSWSNGGTSNFNQNLVAGFYTLTMRDANNCSLVLVDTITQPTALQVSKIVSNISCLGGNTGAINLTILGGTPSYNYIWSNSQISEDISALSVGTYRVTITDAKNCVKIDSASVIAAAPLVVTSFDTAVRCFGLANGKAQLQVSGGALPYHFVWNDGDTSQVRVNLLAGIYSVTVSDNGGCSASDSVFITEPAALVVIGSDTNPTCFGSCNGKIVLSVSGGSGLKNYLWSDANTNAQRSLLCANLYAVTVLDANNCTANYSTTLVAPSAISIIDTSVNVSCFGGNDGAINIGASGGAGGYQFIWSNSTNSQNQIGLTATTYFVTVTDQKNCNTKDTFVVTQPSALVIQGTDSNISCFGLNDGGIAVNASGGNPGYNYSWSNLATDSALLNLGKGTYTVTVYDSRQCSATASFSISEPSEILLQLTATNSLCALPVNGNINLTVTGGTPNYAYGWNNAAITEDIASLGAGWYVVTVSDARGCMQIDSAEILVPAALSVTVMDTDVICFGATNGAAEIFASGGTGAFSYLWSSNGSGSFSNNLTAGNYSVTVRDANLCSATVAFSITQPDSFTVTAFVDSVSCFGGSDGGVNLTISGSNNGYTYVWSNSQTSEDIIGLAAGNFSVTLSDSKNCSVVKSYSVAQPAILQVNLVADSASCYGIANGNIVSNASGGIPNYKYLWSDNSSAVNLSNVVANTYSLTVSDIKNCSVSATASVQQPDSISLSYVTSNAICNGTASGSIDLSVSGGNPSYTYVWSNSDLTQDLTNVLAGSYSVTVQDVKLCSKIIAATVSEPTAILVQLQTDSATCIDKSDGAIDATVSGGNSSYTYLWSNAATTEDIGGLAANTYTVTISDVDLCTAIASATVFSPDSINLLAYNNFVKCFGANDGSIEVIPSGGNPLYSYNWSNSATTAKISALQSSSYDVTVTDEKNCTTTASYYVSQPDSISIITNVTDENCVNAKNGSIVAIVTGGTPTYNYNWSNFAISSNNNNIGSGAYTLTVTDKNSCSATAMAQVNVTADLTLQATTINPPCPQVNSGSVALTALGNGSPFTYLWSDGNTNSERYNLAEGLLSVTVTDKFGCKLDSNFLLSYQYAVEVDATPQTETINLGEQVNITTVVNQNSLLYSWKPSLSLSCSDCPNPIALPVSNVVYTIRVSDSLGCFAEDTVRIRVVPNHALYVPNAFTPNADGVNDAYEIFGNKTAMLYIGIEIFNRWGEKVFESNDLNFKWDGTYRGELLNPGVFVYIINVSFVDGYRIENQKGSLTLIR